MMLSTSRIWAFSVAAIALADLFALARPCPAVTFPAYDEVWSKSGHNSYFASNVPEPFAGGNNQRISDVLLHEAVAMLEFDLKKAEPGRWRVYHTWKLPEFNTQCEYLEDCLARLQNFHFAVPQHEVVNVVIELKETEPIIIKQPVPDIFDATHTVEQLDATIRKFLGPALFTPADFMNDPACQGATTLLACGEARSWPTTAQLRGRFIVNISGNWSSNHFAWAHYATHGEVISARAAFPLRSIFTPCGIGQMTVDGLFPEKPIPPAMLVRARQNSIFWEVWSEEDGVPVPLTVGDDDCGQPGLGRTIREEAKAFLQRQHGILRSVDSFDPEKQQRAVIANGYQYVQSDFAWDYLRDQHPSPTMFVPDPSRRLRDPFVGGRGSQLGREALIEPGNRIYIYNYTHQDALFRSREVRPDQTTTWDAVVATGGIDTNSDDSHPPIRAEDGGEASRGNGCLRAETEDRSEWIMICRRLLLAGEDWLTPENDHTRIVISIEAHSERDGDVRESHKSSRGRVGDGLGDMLQMRVTNRDGAGAEVAVASASQLKGHNILAGPDFRVLKTVRFSQPLIRQGLYAEGDKLFVRPRFQPESERVPEELTLCDLPVAKGDAERSGVVDFSWPVNCPPVLPTERQAGAEPFCPAFENQLCYERCARADKPGYVGNGPLCWEPCRPGYSDDGVVCHLGAKIEGADTSACPRYDLCAQGVIDRKPIGWCSTCQPDPPDRHWKNDGCTCRLEVDVYPKKDFYERGTGWIKGTR